MSDTGPWTVAGDGQVDRPGKLVAMTDKYETTGTCGMTNAYRVSSVRGTARGLVTGATRD